MYNEGQEYEIKYITSEGKESTTNVTPEKNMSIPEMILKLKEENKDFFKLVENKIIKKESKVMKNLYDVLDERNFEDIDIADDENGDLLVAFCLDPNEGDSDTYDKVLTKIAKGLEVYEEQDGVIICKVSDWVRKHLKVLGEMFENDDEEYLVATAFPGIISGYITDEAYNELDSNLNESKEIKTEDNTKEAKVELNGKKRTLYGEDEINCFEAMARAITGLEKFVDNYNVSFAGIPTAYITFKTSDGEGEFEVTFSTDAFGVVENVKTTTSSQKVTKEFLQLGELLINIK